jgi:hypothetical protein
LKSINPLYKVNVNEFLKGCCVVMDKQTINTPVGPTPYCGHGIQCNALYNPPTLTQFNALHELRIIEERSDNWFYEYLILRFSPRLQSGAVKIKMYRTTVLFVVCMRVKLGL